MKKHYLFVTAAFSAFSFLAILAHHGTEKTIQANQTFGARAAEEIFDEVYQICENKGGWTYEVTECVEERTKAIVNAEPQPIAGAIWSPRTQTWICPTSKYNTTYYDCSHGKRISNAQFALNTEVEACVGRANKEEGSLGESWAQGECQNNTSAF